MYSIIRQLDGSYLTLCRIQDGTERSIHTSIDDAIQSLIRGAKIMNGVTITESDIKFGKEKSVVITEVEWDQPKNKCCHCKH